MYKLLRMNYFLFKLLNEKILFAHAQKKSGHCWLNVYRSKYMYIYLLFLSSIHI